MTTQRLMTLSLTLGFLLFFPQLGSAQQGGQQGQQGGNQQQGQAGQQQQMQLPPSVQAMFEFRNVRNRLQKVRQQAFEDSALAERARNLEEELLAAMEEIDPKAGEYVEQLKQMEKEFSSAQSMKDSTMSQEIAQEGRKLDQKIGKLRSQALEDEALVEKIDRFQQDIETKMQEIEPKLDSLRARADTLQQFLRENLPQQQQQQPGGQPGGAGGGGGGQ